MRKVVFFVNATGSPVPPLSVSISANEGLDEESIRTLQPLFFALMMDLHRKTGGALTVAMSVGDDPPIRGQFAEENEVRG